jgi:hypothetical protein
MRAPANHRGSRLTGNEVTVNDARRRYRELYGYLRPVEDIPLPGDELPKYLAKGDTVTSSVWTRKPGTEIERIQLEFFDDEQW